MHQRITDTWKAIPGFEWYEASDLGRVRSLDRTIETRCGARFFRGRVLKPTPDKNGYQKVALYGELERRVAVHRLVLEAFVGFCPDGMECRHLDGNPENNRLDNLAWGTPAENSADRRVHGTDIKGEKHHKSKLTEADVVAIRYEYADGTATLASLGRKYGVSRPLVGTIVRNETWTHIEACTEGVSYNGSRRVNSKLTEAMVVEMRERRVHGVLLSELASAYGVSKGTVWRIVNRKTWRHVQ